LRPGSNRVATSCRGNFLKCSFKNISFLLSNVYDCFDGPTWGGVGWRTRSRSKGQKTWSAKQLSLTKKLSLHRSAKQLSLITIDRKCKRASAGHVRWKTNSKLFNKFWNVM
jgi:hypothetical protein